MARPNLRGISTPRFSILAVVLGVVAGFGALGFRILIAVLHNLLLLGTLSITYDTSAHTASSPWGVFVILAPVLAALGVVLVTERFAPEARGHGVPEVMDAIHYHDGKIRPVVAVVKSIASALSIGSGGSVGREGPIVQIGAAGASWLGQRCKLARWQLVTLVAAGGGAGIAATFNTPIGGVLFAVEVLMQELSVRTLVPVALATATATFVGRFVFGNHPAFVVPALHMSPTAGLALLPAYAVLGCLTAFVSAAFIKVLYGTEDRLDARVRDPYARHVLGMFGVGVTMVALHATTGHYYVEGVGYATVTDVLSQSGVSLGLLGLLLVLKMIVTSLTLGSGASGGVFSPALFMGATLGGAYGVILDMIFPSLQFDPTALALAGMAGVVAGTTGAALTAIVMIFEMTLDYSVVLPMTITVAIAHGLRTRLIADSIYTMKLTRRGHVMPVALQAPTYLVHHVGELALGAVETLPTETPASQVAPVDHTPPYLVVVVDHHVVKLIARESLAGHPGATQLGELPTERYIVVSPRTPLIEALADVQAAGANYIVVAAAHGDVQGVITKIQLTDALAARLTALAD